MELAGCPIVHISYVNRGDQKNATRPLFRRLDFDDQEGQRNFNLHLFQPMSRSIQATGLPTNGALLEIKLTGA